jgi:hypothetical protein
VVQQTVEIHGDGELGSDPAALGQLAALHGPPGQLNQGISAALAAAGSVVGVAWAGQGLQGGQEALAGLRRQQPLAGDPALQGRGQPQPPPPMAALGLAVGGLGVGDQPQVADDSSQLGWVQPSGRIHQDRLGRGRGLGRSWVP